jgi:transcriptional regulator with XRE-family HTH domain
MSMSEHDEDWVPQDTFGARLALIRQRKNWNVKEAADACGLNHQSWRNWEDGKGVQHLEEVAKKIAAAAGCSRRWLMAGGPLMEWNADSSPDLGIVPDPTDPIQMVLFEPDPLPGPRGLVDRLFGRRKTDINLA